MLRRSPSRRRGQALTELVLSLPILLSVLLLIVEGTLVVSSSQSLTDAVHQSARVAAQQRLSRDQIRQRIEAILSTQPLVDPQNMDVTVRRGVDTNGSPNVRVVARLPVRPFLFTRAATFRLSADATYRVPSDPADNPS